MSAMSLPSVVIVGRPNVGKSSLFNCLTKSRQALVADSPGLTRDRLYGLGSVGDQPYLVIDTGGLTVEKKIGISSLMEQQTQQAIQEADYLLFVVDGRAGLTTLDELLAKKLRQWNKKITLVINKCEGLEEASIRSEFSRLGLDSLALVSAAHGQGMRVLMSSVFSHSTVPVNAPDSLVTPEIKETKEASVRVAMVGKPNVGKSTLVNRILGEERVIVFDQPGTTRDSTEHFFTYRGKQYTLIDTAGIRRSVKLERGIEKFSVIKSLQAVESCQVALLLIDATEGVSEQDLHLLGFILEVGRGLVIAVNKWDGLSAEQRSSVKKSLDRRLQFVKFAKLIFISALYGTGVGNLFGLVQQAYRSATHTLLTSHLTRLLEQAVSAHQPPLGRGGRLVKLRYAHPGGYNPPRILVHGQHTQSLPESYRRYLENFYRDSLRIVGSPIRIEFKDK